MLVILTLCSYIYRKVNSEPNSSVNESTSSEPTSIKIRPARKRNAPAMEAAIDPEPKKKRAPQICKTCRLPRKGHVCQGNKNK